LRGAIARPSRWAIAAMNWGAQRTVDRLRAAQHGMARLACAHKKRNEYLSTQIQIELSAHFYLASPTANGKEGVSLQEI
jgi:hypothetical protein